MKPDSLHQHKARILISGGGTGGHVFPAIAIADAVRRLNPETEILFIGAKGKMEMQRVPEAGYPIKGLWISGFHRSLNPKNLLFPLKLLVSMVNAWDIIRRFRPDVVVGVGGFASGPALRIACARGIPALIQEQNSFPGITNRLLAHKVQRICVAYPGMEAFFPPGKIVITGNPVRKEVLDIKGKEQEASRYFGFSGSRKTLLILGGSQGAMTINMAVRNNLERWIRDGIRIIWQTGKPGYDDAREATGPFLASDIKVMGFIDRMDLAYAMADLIISRAGAIAISEICAAGKPVVFVPFPGAAGDHQRKNATKLVEAGAALMVENHLAADQLGDLILLLFGNPAEMAEMVLNISGFAVMDADERIAREILDLRNSVSR
ncbi:MAG: undecaprenyldiphospho-muramoylpentapeptide beta-N-acetylglucosaminyltransferase [Bacteroidales bacterium]|nr:undecaprenyldiphospho-muramoylpentapeptide beta-N-acetylglucosaminyltransferase [Bacteroidales bacterium]